MKDPRETIIDRVHNEDFCSVYTEETKFMNQLRKLQKEYPEEVTIKEMASEGEIYAIKAEVPYDWMKFVSPKKKGRTFTEEEKALASERLAKARQAKEGK